MAGGHLGRAEHPAEGEEWASQSQGAGGPRNGVTVEPY